MLSGRCTFYSSTIFLCPIYISDGSTAIQTSIRTIFNYQKLITPTQYGEILLLIDFPKLTEHELKNAVAKINQAIKMRTEFTQDSIL